MLHRQLLPCVTPPIPLQCDGLLMLIIKFQSLVLNLFPSTVQQFNHFN